LEISPEDASAIGIADEDRVKVSSRRGDITVSVKVTDALPQGTVFMTCHFAENPVNMLTSTIVDPVSGMPEYSCAVKITKA